MVRKENTYSLFFPSKPRVFISPKFGEIRGNEFRFNENFIETPKLSLES